FLRAPRRLRARLPVHPPLPAGALRSDLRGLRPPRRDPAPRRAARGARPLAAGGAAARRPAPAGAGAAIAAIAASAAILGGRIGRLGGTTPRRHAEPPRAPGG